MGMADSDNAGGSGNTGGGSSSGGRGGGSGGGGGGGRSTNSGGRDTPGSPNAADGRRGSSMGRDGGVAGGSTGGGGASRDTPGPVDANDGRRGSSMGRVGSRASANGSTAAGRARSAFGRHASEGLYGEGESYSLASSLNEDKLAGALSPKNMDMAIGMTEGRQKEGLMGTFGSVIGATAGRIGSALGLDGIPGVGSVGKKALGALASTGIPDNPESSYGAAVADNAMANTSMQSAGAAIAGLLGGPAGAMAADGVNTAMSLSRTSDIAELGEGLTSSSTTGSVAASGTVGGGTPGTARDAMNARTTQAAAMPGRPAFSWSPVDMNEYSRGLIRPNMG